MADFTYNVGSGISFDDAKKEYLSKLSKEEYNMLTSFEQQTRNYKAKHIKYFNRTCDSKDLIDDITQPYYQSLVLSRKRLEQKNLSIDMNIDTHFISDKMPFSYKEDNKFYSGERQDALKIKRSFLLYGKKIFKNKSKETSKITFLKSKVSENEDTFCPNCGVPGKLSSFLDGCDSCDSKFTVNDFEPKIAAFSLQENRVSKYYGSILRSWVLYALFIILISVFFVLKADWVQLICTIVPAVVSFVPSLIILLFIISILLKNVWSTVVNEDIVTKDWKWFSTNDFLQNLEYKIKNIHFAKNYEEVSAFARCSLLNAVSNYQNVIECDLANIKFLDATNNSNGYNVSFDAVFRVVELEGKKVRTHYETVKGSTYGKKGVVDQPITVLREYKCDKCGSSINVLEGSTCRFCDTKYDYTNYNWILTDYEPKKNFLSVYSKAKIGYFFYFTLIYIIARLLIFGMM